MNFKRIGFAAFPFTGDTSGFVNRSVVIEVNSRQYLVATWRPAHNPQDAEPEWLIPLDEAIARDVAADGTAALQNSLPRHWFDDSLDSAERQRLGHSAYSEIARIH